MAGRQREWKLLATALRKLREGETMKKNKGKVSIIAKSWLEESYWLLLYESHGR